MYVCMYVCDMSDSVRKLGSVQDSHRMIRSRLPSPPISVFCLVVRTEWQQLPRWWDLVGGRSDIIYECLINTEPLKYFTPPPPIHPESPH